MSYTVKASDIIGSKLKIRVVFIDAVQGTIEFETASVTCQNTNSYHYTDVTSGSPIQETDKLKFEAIVPTDKVVENWYINDVKQKYETDSRMFYTVKASDIVGGKLKVRVVFKDIVKIEFDSASVKCQNTKSYPYTDVTSGSQIQENDELKFEAIVPTGKIVENWYINDVKQEYQTDSTMFYTVKASDIVGGKLKISVVFKAPVQGTIEFETASVTCQNTNSYHYTDVTSGSPIQEKDKLKFEAILPTGKIVENWYINDVKQKYETDSTMSYTVEASDIVGGKLKISVVFKDIVTIEFDSTRIKCQKKNFYTYTDVTSGSQIQEKDELKFEAIVPSGKIVENWYINDVKQESKTDSTMSYTVKASDIVGRKLKISVVFKDAAQGTIEFDSASVTCQNINSYPYIDVTSGSPIQETDKLKFESILLTGKIVENWYINNVKQEYKTNSTMFYTVKTSDIVGSKLKVRVVFK